MTSVLRRSFQDEYVDGATNLLARVEWLRVEAYRQLAPAQRSAKGQFFTPPAVAELIASMVMPCSSHVRLLDAGAGVGALTAAFVVQACNWAQRPRSLAVVCYEFEPLLVTHLHETLAACAVLCAQAGIAFESQVVAGDFVAAAVESLQPLFGTPTAQFTHAILNPPYHKIQTASSTRQLLRSIGIETSNIYTAFLWLASRLLAPGGELVAITPRSFCNGPYFLPFRKAFFADMQLRRVHLFEARNKAFAEDDVLQENIIHCSVKSHGSEPVIISSSIDPADEDIVVREVAHDQVVQPGDPQLFVHLVPNHLDQQIRSQVQQLSMQLSLLGLSVSTGRVIDFRATQHLTTPDEAGAVPLIYPAHFKDGAVVWPLPVAKKLTALKAAAAASNLLVPSGYYVLVKRFSSREERRRVVAAVYDPTQIAAAAVGFENHLNYYHQQGIGLPAPLARGLAAFLNSTLVDAFFRQFNGHTQVNVADLRMLRYPSAAQLCQIGEHIGSTFPAQDDLDRLVASVLALMPGDLPMADPLQAKQKISEALAILKALGVPRAQQNDRSALTLLALLDVQPATGWADAASPQYGITEMMNYFRDHYGVVYAPNTRETVRRQTIHQFVQLGLVVENAETPRPPNSPKTRYQIEPAALSVMQTFGTVEWPERLNEYLSVADRLRSLQAREREMTLLPVRLPSGEEVLLSGGGQNDLIKAIVEQFCPRFTPAGVVIALGDAAQTQVVQGTDYLAKLGVTLPERGKMPDVIVHHTTENWLVLIEAVTSHGPLDIKRHNELKQLFATSSAPLVFVTAFANRKAMVKYLAVIAWETEVWLADEPAHLIHFNGERFLGPYSA